MDDAELDSRQQAAFEILEQRVERLRLEAKSRAIIKRALNEGDAYREVILNPQQDTIVDFREVSGAKEGYVMRKLLDFASKAHVGWALYQAKHAELVAVYAPWQIIQFSWNQVGHYGIPLLHAARHDVARNQKAEESMAIARDERAYMKMIHKYPDGTSDEELQRVMRQHQLNKMNRRNGPSTDIFTAATVTPVDPSNTQLAIGAEPDQLLERGDFTRDHDGRPAVDRRDVADDRERVPRRRQLLQRLVALERGLVLNFDVGKFLVLGRGHVGDRRAGRARHGRVRGCAEDTPQPRRVGVGAHAQAQATDASTSGLEQRPPRVGLAVLVDDVVTIAADGDAQSRH